MNCSGIDVATGRFVAIEFGEAITEIRELNDPAANELWLAPGFVDLQVNGFAGVDFNDPSAEQSDIERALQSILATGVTRCLPTVITAAPADMLACLRNLGNSVAGFHVEGPHIGAEDGPRGAHPSRWVRAPDFEEYLRWQEATDGRIRLITLSPEWPSAPQYIESVVARGTAVAIGHTSASGEQIRAAVDAAPHCRRTSATQRTQ